MNKSELKKQIEALQAQYDAMPDEAVSLFEVAGYGQEYYSISGIRTVYSTENNETEIDYKLIELGNHFTDKAEAERVAAFMRKNFLYWRMALRFADGYEFKGGEHNYFVFENKKTAGIIYMSQENAERFAEFCNKHREELGL